jgi:hypothetical protein
LQVGESTMANKDGSRLERICVGTQEKWRVSGCSCSLEFMMLIEQHALMSSSICSWLELKYLMRTISRRAESTGMLYSSADHKLWYFLVLLQRKEKLVLIFIIPLEKCFTCK